MPEKSGDAGKTAGSDLPPELRLDEPGCLKRIMRYYFPEDAEEAWGPPSEDEAFHSGHTPERGLTFEEWMKLGGPDLRGTTGH